MQIRYTNGARIKRGSDYCPELRSATKMLRCRGLWERTIGHDNSRYGQGEEQQSYTINITENTVRCY